MIKDKIATLSAGSTRTNTLPTASTSSAHKVTVDPDRPCNVILFGNAEDNRQGSGCLERACAEVT